MKIKKSNIDRSLSPTTLSYTHIHCRPHTHTHTVHKDGGWKHLSKKSEKSGTTFPAVSRGSDLTLEDGSLPRTVGSFPFFLVFFLKAERTELWLFSCAKVENLALRMGTTEKSKMKKLFVIFTNACFDWFMNFLLCLDKRNQFGCVRWWLLRDVPLLIHTRSLVLKPETIRQDLLIDSDGFLLSLFKGTIYSPLPQFYNRSIWLYKLLNLFCFRKALKETTVRTKRETHNLTQCDC